MTDAMPRPPATRKEPRVEILHGEAVADDYRWLETPSAETLDWIQAQNRYTEDVLTHRPEVAAMRRALSAALAAGLRVMAPQAVPGRIFCQRRLPDERQAVLIHWEPGAEPAVLYDPAREAYQPTALDHYAPSPSGRYVALSTSRDGSEDSSLTILEVATGRWLPDQIPGVGYSGVTWAPDESGFYYSRRPRPGEVPAGEEMYHRHLRYHLLGTDPEGDPDLFGAGRPIRDGHWVRLSQDGRWMYLFTGDGWRRTDVYRRPAADPEAPFTPLLVGYDATFTGVERDGRLLLRTNHGAERYRIVEVDPEHPEESRWREVVPASPLVVRGFALAGDHLLVHALEDVSSSLFLLDLRTGRRTAVRLPAHGAVSAVTEGPHQDFLFMFESFLEAPALYRVGTDGAAERLLASTTAPGVEDLVVRQEFYTAADGLRCPLYLVHRRDLGPGPHPTVLTGYGGFNIALQSHYAPEILPWVRAGGVFAQANMRGGGEYGEGWHRMGMEEHRQESFDDFRDAARHLIAQGVTDSAHLGVSGRSLGGLLTGVFLTQNPDLASAVVSGVPLLDMLRYHLFLIGALWIVEYGSPEVAEQFRWLKAYSPYHNVRDGTRYPAVYFMAAMNDGRVDPCHARKMTARLQEAVAGVDGAGPVLLRTHFNAGHGAGKPLDALVDEQAEIWGFLAWRCGLPLTW